MTAKELRALRARTRLSQVKFAQLLDTTPTTVSRWERGEQPVDALKARGICEIIRERFPMSK